MKEQCFCYFLKQKSKMLVVFAWGSGENVLNSLSFLVAVTILHRYGRAVCLLSNAKGEKCLSNIFLFPQNDSV